MKIIKNVIWAGLFSMTLIALAGCRTSEIYNVNDQTIPNFSGGSLTTNQVKGAITKAAVGLGWKVKDVQPGLIYASIDLRSHYAEVKIPYTNHSYSIIYRNSSNLAYDGTHIHSNYNNWVKNLDGAIQANLAQAMNS